DCLISDEMWGVTTLSGIVRERGEESYVVLSTSELGAQSSSSEVEPSESVSVELSSHEEIEETTESVTTTMVA
ncbi:hypothetical protein KI387_039713, partial [Taxus chinensis]